MPELLAVIVLLGALVVAGLPRLAGALAQRDDHARDRVLAALRHAQATAHSRHRLVCATVARGAVTLRVASAHPASGCDSALPGPGVDAHRAPDAHHSAGAASPALALYFQPDGRISSDSAGRRAGEQRIVIDGQAPVVVVGETGHVR